MTTLRTFLSILSFKNDIVVNSPNIDCLNLSDGTKSTPEHYSLEKQDYTRIIRQSTAKTSQRVKDSLKELEQVFSNSRCIDLQWRVQENILLFFCSGTLATIQLNGQMSAVEKVIIDNTLCGKLFSDHITDVVFNNDCLLVSYSEPKLTYINFSKNLHGISNLLLGSKRSKIVGHDPQITTIDLPGPSNRRLEKKISLNNVKDCVLVWWCFTSNDVWPWMPVSHSIDRINFLVYALKDNSIEILCSMKVHGELQHACFSRWHSNRVLTLEEVKEGNEYIINICTYEVFCGHCQCTSLLKLPLQSRIAAFDWSSLEDKLLICDQEMSLLVYDVNANTTIVTSILFVAKEIAWHPDGVIACVVGANGSVQCFDAALSSLQFQLYIEDLKTQHSIELQQIMHPHKRAQKVTWKNSNLKQNLCGMSDLTQNAADSILVYFENGIFIFINLLFGFITKNVLTPLEMISQYLRSNSIDEAVCLLQGMHWGQQTELCFQCLSGISNSLLRRPLTLKTETALQRTLGTFYDSTSTLPEKVLYDYHQQIDHLARRFFHLLLRYHRLEKAYLLAVNLQSRNLFLDLHHVAKVKGETVLAFVCLKHAEQLTSSESSTSSFMQSNSSESDTSSISSSETRRISVLRQMSFSSPSGASYAYSKEAQSPFSPQNFSFMSQYSSQLQPPPNASIFLPNLIESSPQLGNSNISFLQPVNTQITPKLSSQQIKTKDSHLQPVNKFNNLFNHQKLEYNEQNNNQTSLNENVEEEDDLEGAHVKFVHFGII